MQFVFKGVPGESHASVNMYGVEFPLGVPTSIESDKAARKLAGHPHFDAVAEPTADTPSPREDHDDHASATTDTQAVKRGPGRPKKA